MNIKSNPMTFSIVLNIIFLIVLFYILVNFHVTGKIKSQLNLKDKAGDRKASFVMTGDSLISQDWERLLSKKDIMFVTSRSASIDFVIENLDRIIKTKPKQCVVTANGYDVYMENSPADVFKKYKYLISNLREAGIKVVVQTALTSVPAKFEMIQYGEKVSELNQLLKDYCDIFDIKYIELNDLLSQNYHYKPEYSDEIGVFPNRKGYEIWAATLLNVLDSMGS
jgi:hypothetical protein